MLLKAAEGIRTLDIHVGKAGESAVSATYWVPEYAGFPPFAIQVQGGARFDAGLGLRLFRGHRFGGKNG